MEIAGYIAALLIGVSLGLIGGGGSILTVPVLVYLLGIDPVLATAYSLFIVGATSLAGVFPKYKLGLVNLKTAVIFGIPSILAVFLTRKFLIPWIPDQVFDIAGFAVTKSILMMLLFAVLMLAASVSMIRDKKQPLQDAAQQQFNYTFIMIEGAVVGLLTGMVGAGGGFLIIPALVFFSKLPMKQAVGTSLLIIAAKSLIGFTGDLSNLNIDWLLLLSVTAIAVAGIFIGNLISNKTDGEKLKKGFGWLVLVMGVFVIVKEIFFR